MAKPKKKKASKLRAFPKDSPEAELLLKMAHRIQVSLDAVTSFANKLKAKPSEANIRLEWDADKVCEAAADLQVATLVREALTKKDSLATFETIREYALREVNWRARTLSRSTSAGSNLMEEHRRAAWADVVEQMLWIKPPKAADPPK